MNYSWIAILVNVPATIFAPAYYECLMRDSLQGIAKGHGEQEHEHGDEGQHRHLSRLRQMERKDEAATITGRMDQRDDTHGNKDL